jgi:nucleoside 2-deoxyribosyltransferase
MKSVVICGSRRFKPEARKFAAGLKKLGAVVYEPYFHSGEKEWEVLSEDYKKFIALGLTHDHFYKIKMADIVFLYNPDGYAGVSTTLELGYAMALGKPIYAFSDKDKELCRKVLVRGVTKTPKELVKILK